MFVQRYISKNKDDKSEKVMQMCFEQKAKIG